MGDCVQVSEAMLLESLGYHEAWELSYFGASVLHPRTTLPAMKFDIPIVIRNFFNQAAPGVPLPLGLLIMKASSSCKAAQA